MEGRQKILMNSFFEFDILCRSYDYVTDAQKLKLFPATLKDNALCWFMSLGGGTVANWDKMKQVIIGNLGSKMGLIRKRAKISCCELEFKNQ